MPEKQHKQIIPSHWYRKISFKRQKSPIQARSRANGPSEHTQITRSSKPQWFFLRKGVIKTATW